MANAHRDFIVKRILVIVTGMGYASLHLIYAPIYGRLSAGVMGIPIPMNVSQAQMVSISPMSANVYQGKHQRPVRIIVPVPPQILTAR